VPPGIRPADVAYDGGVPTVSAIVPATNRPVTLDECRAAILRAAEPPDELILVEEPPGIGPAAARNTGATRATGDVLVFVDSDVIVHEDAFTRIRRHFAEDPGLAAVFGAYDDNPAQGLVSTFRNLLHHHVHHSSPGPAATFWAGLGAVRRDVFTAHGGFDAQRYPRATVEDIELGMRLAAANERLVLDPAIQGRHLKRWTLGGMIRSDFRDRGIPWATLLLERGNDSGVLNLGWRHRASAAAAVGFVAGAAAGRPRAALAALASLVALNRSFYRLLARRTGPTRASAGVSLHVLHHLTGVAAFCAAALAKLTRR
jgi:glycosyltransferase involved in cell wall biosynthesis